MGLDCGGKCGMFFLVTINGIFMALGIAMLVVGILLKVDLGDVIVQEKIVDTLNEVSINNLKLGSLASSLPIILIVIGVVVMLVAGLGMCGACCKNRCMLVMYAIIVLLVFILQIAAIALYATMKNKIEDEAKSKLKTSLNKYAGETSTNEISVGWDLLFISFKCCGVDAAYTNNAEFQTTAWWTGGSRGADLVPNSCCIAATQDNYKTDSNFDAGCTQLTDPTKYHNKGCYEAIKDYLLKYQNAAIGVGVAILIIELIGIIFAFVLCRAIGKSEELV